MREITARTVVLNGLPICAIGRYDGEGELFDVKLHWCKEAGEGEWTVGCRLSDVVVQKITEHDMRRVVQALAYQLAKEEQEQMELWWENRWEDRQYNRYGWLPY